MVIITYHLMMGISWDVSEGWSWDISSPCDQLGRCGQAVTKKRGAAWKLRHEFILETSMPKKFESGAELVERCWKAISKDAPIFFHGEKPMGFLFRPLMDLNRVTVERQGLEFGANRPCHFAYSTRETPFLEKWNSVWTYPLVI
jgi:hypothetical protein